ncbi:asparagine synthetase B [Chitinophaga sp. Cy-1792]|uniref:asparagine synthetase B family protein n=1 Tax=Chitinophaga sp. Cy-1792 TaxID=2608339 RepID=UPI001421DF2F|nr:asparagine synthase-related protein [Chitinophaga sp. Cy-1792]NIG55369.1 hypothetical protein [Chitinophaga sp. Cy-1792]
MSGFIGILTHQLDDKDVSLLDVAASAFTATCNDYSGAWCSERAGLRFGWLKTTADTENEYLPFTLDGNLRIIGDVRLDNRAALIQQLALHGATVSTSTPDAYLVLHAFQLWGEDCLQHISGDFAFAIWNEQTEYLFAARDHFGLIPFYYTQFDEKFLFTNFYLSLKYIPQLVSELDDNVLNDYLVKGVNRSFDQTIYKKIKKLPPAHQLSYNKGSVSIRRYWEVPAAFEPIRYASASEYTSQFFELFQQSVKDRTRTDKVACTLSGGMDSSAITATAKKILAEKYGDNHTLIAYNISYQQLVTENEGFFSKLTATHLNIPVRHYIGDDFISNIAAPLTSWLPEPAGVPDATAESSIISDAEGFSRVLLNGFGGDPMFGSQQHFKRTHFLSRLLKIYTSSLLKIRKKAKDLIIKDKKAALPAWYEEDLHNYKENSVCPHSIVAMLENPYWAWVFESSHPGFTGNKIKIRQPFFSLDLFLYVAAVPQDLLYKKTLLRMAMIPLLPEAVVQRPKTPLFGNPHMQTIKATEIQNILKQSIAESGDFLKGKINTDLLLNEINNTTISPSPAVVNLLQLLSWNNYRYNNPLL